jgi:glycosyltransferase involved in cell wall biosynthesis
VQVAVRAQVERLVKRGHRVTVVAPYRLYLPLPRYAAKRREIPPGPRSEREGNVRIFRPRHLHVPGLWRALDPFAVILALLEAALRSGPPDLIHGHWLHPHGFAAAVVGRLLNRPVILSVYGSDVARLASETGRTYYRPMMAAATQWSDQVICVSRATAEELAAKGVQREWLLVIPTGVDLDRFAPRDRGACRAELARALGRPVGSHAGPLLLFAGNLVPVKQVDRLLRAVAGLPRDVQLVIVGEGSEGDRLRALAGELGLHDRVVFAGWRPREEIPTWLAAADLIVLPSASEGMPLILLEALASGTPVVASRVGGVPECVEDGVTGILVDPASVEGLAKGLTAALARPWDRAALGAAARGFGWDAVATRLESLYRQFC